MAWNAYDNPDKLQLGQQQQRNDPKDGIILLPSKRQRKSTNFFVKESSNIEEVQSCLIRMGVAKRSIRDDMISTAIDVFEGNIEKAVGALIQNVENPYWPNKV